MNFGVLVCHLLVVGGVELLNLFKVALLIVSLLLLQGLEKLLKIFNLHCKGRMLFVVFTLGLLDFENRFINMALQVSSLVLAVFEVLLGL